MKAPPCKFQQRLIWPGLFSALLALVCVPGCSSLPTGIERPSSVVRSAPGVNSQEKANDVVLYALGLIDTGYRFGGKNPTAGFDCSGMVSYIFTQAADLPVSGNAADIAHRGKPVDLNQLRPGDLVFFNTRHKPFSHVGIYIGNDRFVHAPSEAGLARVRTDSLKNQYFASRLEAARSLLD